MKKYKLGRIIDFVFKTTLLFLIFFVWIRFYVVSLNLTLIYSIIATLLLSLILHYIKQKKFKQEYLTKEEQAKIEVYINEFLFSSTKTNFTFFYNLLNKKHKAVYEKPFLVLNKTSFKIALYPYYKMRKLTMDTAKNLVILAKAQNINKLIVCCKTCEQEVLNLSKQLKELRLIILDQKQTYFKLLKPFEHYPKITNRLIEENKLTKTQMLHVMFDKRRTKGYFISGTILMLSSLIVPYNLYYVIFGSLLYFMPENMLEENDN
jgi:hypothetical protein